LFLEFGAELASEGSADVAGRLIQRHEDGVVGGDTYREFGEIHADVVSVRQRHLDVIDLGDVVKNEFLGDVHRVLHGRREDSNVGGSRKDFDNRILNFIPDFAIVDVDGGVGPAREDAGAEDAILGIRQGSVIVADEVDKRRLRRFQHAEILQSRLQLNFTSSGEGSGSETGSYRRHDEGVVVLLSIGIDTLPWILFDVDFDFEDVAVGGDEMAAEEDGELFRAAHAVLLRQQVHRVLLRVGGDDVAVVAILVIFVGCQREFGVDFQLLDGVEQSVAFDVKQLHIIFAVSVVHDRVRHFQQLPTKTQRATNYVTFKSTNRKKRQQQQQQSRNNTNNITNYASNG